MIANPKFNYGDKVMFLCEREKIVGTIVVVDEEGTFPQNDEPSYDIMVGSGDKRCLYKHVNESFVLSRCDDENETQDMENEI